MEDRFNLGRFVDAQNDGENYRSALAEIRSGRKVSHWIWYVFPQLAGLGTSRMSRKFAISSTVEAHVYALHSVLGPRLHQSTLATLGHPDKDVSAIFGFDNVKFHSSMTLFMRANPSDIVFREAIDLFFSGVTDERTDDLLLDS